MPRPEALLPYTGIGLRQPHVAALLQQRAGLGFVEVHSENFFAEGGAARQVLADLRAHYPVSLHGVGLSLGSACGIDEAHLAKLARLVDEIDPVRVSDHASFARAPLGTAPATIVHAADLLPLALTPASLDVLVANVQHVQERLQRPILIENLSAYFSYDDDVLSEVEFLTQACLRSGCQLLLDLNNLLVNGLNRARRQAWAQGLLQADATASLVQARAQALDFVWSLPAHLVGQIHLAGFRWPERPDRLVIDDHSQRVSPTEWDVYEQAIAHLGPVPTLIEWDTDLPPLAVLLDEATLAGRGMARALGWDDADDTGDADEQP
jgi:uncharacterized protein (UPF0276 family)